MNKCHLLPKMAVKVTIHPSKFPVTIPQFLRVERMYNMCKMENYFLISALAILIGVTPVHGQVNLSGMEPASTDSLVKSRIRYFSPGMGGRNKVWDFSEKLGSKEASKVMFMKDSTGVVSFIEPGRSCYYRTTPDTLILFGSESALEKREYTVNKVSKYFPLEYGDSISKHFRCEGMYCGDHPFREVGTMTAKVDADGLIVLAENDTVRNVLRVHTIDSYSICMDIDTAALDTARLTQVIDERYEWYLPESQYPIIEDVASTTYHNMEAIGTTRYAYCNLPEDLADDYITLIDEDEADEQDGFSDEGQQIPDIIHYNIETQGKVINMSYDLDEDATITTIVANHMGFLSKYDQWTQAAGQGCSAQIDCNGLSAGIYILYINVNGKVYSEKVTL